MIVVHGWGGWFATWYIITIATTYGRMINGWSTANRDAGFWELRGMELMCIVFAALWPITKLIGVGIRMGKNDK